MTEPALDRALEAARKASLVERLNIRDENDRIGLIGKEAADALSTLSARNAELERQVAAQAALIEQAREALKPFARVADMEERSGPNDSVMVNVARCRDARSTLTALEASNVE